jgi:predicted dehydrogenase
MYKVGLIGLGGMASGGEPGDPYAYSHAAGIFHNGRFELAAAADISTESIARFSGKWGQCFPKTKYHTSTTELINGLELDVVDICTRGRWHFPIAMEVIRSERPPKVIFIEKAPTASLLEMDTMAAEAAEKGILIMVSYSRHWYPHMSWLKTLLDDGLIGRVKTVVGYCKGWLLSMSSHQTDMICQFAGYDPVAVTAVGRVENDPDMTWHSIDNPPEGYEPEPLLDSMVIEYKSGIIGYHISDHNDYWGLYCDIFGTKGRVRIQSDLMQVSGFLGFDKPIDFGAYNIPPKKGVFDVAYNQIADYLEGGPPPECSGSDYTAVQEIGYGAVESIYQGGRITLPVVKRDRKIHIL